MTSWGSKFIAWLMAESEPYRTPEPCDGFLRELHLANNGDCARCGHPRSAHTPPRRLP